VETVKINSRQFTLLVIMYTMGSSVLLIPSTLASFAKNNAWISSIVGLILGLLFILLFVKISTVYPKKTFVEINRMVFGRWLGNFFSILFLFSVFIMAAGNLREIGDFFTSQVMVETPIHAIHLLTLVAAIYVIRKGLEVMARTCEIFFPWTGASLIILFLFLIPEMKFENLVPNFVNGIGPTLGPVFLYLNIPFNELVVFLMILPYVNNVSKGRKGYFIGVLIGGLGVTIITVMCLGVLGADFTGRNLYPTYVLGKMISIGNFFERIEVLVAISWIFSIFFKLIVNIFVLVFGLSQILKMNDFKPLTFPLGFLLMVYSLVNYPNIIYFKESILIWSPFAMTFFFLLPLIMLIVGFIKTKMNKQESL
jgi:spore germination protein KB